MTENASNLKTQGVISMKKTILVVALAVALVLSFASAAYAIGPFFGTAGTYNTGADADHVGVRYLSWDWAVAQDPTNNTGSPHGGYTATTNKCAVCHSVHQAVAGGSVLTAYGPYATYAQGCVACHGDGTTFTDVKMTANADGYISPHGTCTRCHTLNPHGAGGSIYPVLSAKLLNTVGDAAITTDLDASNNGLVADMFDGSATLSTEGLILGTGYLCGGCHNQSFAVNTPSADPASGSGHMTGHRVLASATSSWDAATYGASTTQTTVAWNSAFGCDSCHNAAMSDGSSAFPHGYVDASGAVSPKTVAGSSYIWLTTASDSTLADAAILATTEPDQPILLTEDGLCLKCHRNGAGSGVGLSY
jgi:hypothetical protein